MSRPFPRPMSAGEVLDMAFQVYRRQFLALFLTTAVSMLPFMILWTAIGAYAGEATAPVGAMMALLLVVTLPFTLIVWAALATLVERGLAGESVSIGAALGAGVRRLLPMVGMILIVYLLLMITFGVLVLGVSVLSAVVAGVGGPIAGGAVGIVLGVACGISIAIWWGALAFIAVPAQVIEKLGPVATLKRTNALLRGGRLRTGGIAIVAWLIVAIPTFAVVIAGIGFAAAGSDPTAALTNAGPMLNGVTLILSALTTPYFIACAVVAYFDRRARAEGYDLELASQALAPAS